MLKHVTIEAKRIDDVREVDIKKGPNKGTRKKVYNCSLKILGKWYRGTVWEKDKYEAIGSEADIEMFQTEYQGRKYWNWRLPSSKDFVMVKLIDLERRIKLLEEYIKSN